MESSIRCVTYNEGSNKPAMYPASQQDSWTGVADSFNWIPHIGTFSTTGRGETENRRTSGIHISEVASTNRLDLVKQNTKFLANDTVRISKIIQFFDRENREKTHYVRHGRFDGFFRDSLPLWVYESPATLSDELPAALSDLQEVTEEAQEEGFPIPTPIAFGNAERCLGEMYEIYPRRYEVYPTHDGEIVIDAPSGFGTSVVLMCDSAGGALCLVNLKSGQRHRRYASAHAFPDDFLRDSLIALGRERN